MNFFLKIETYLKILKLVTTKKKQTLILTPNVNTLFQIKYFLKKKNNIPIDVYHSKLNNKQKCYILEKAKIIKNIIIISTANGIFIPFCRLGLIIIDQENSTEYIKQKPCYYNTKFIAIIRAYQENIPIILESITPDLLTLKKLHSKKYLYFNLYKKNIKYVKNTTNIIDMKKSKCYGIFSTEIIKKIYSSLKNQKTTILIIAKKMIFFSVLICLHCSLIMKCSTCNNFYKLNTLKEELFCHNCFSIIKQFVKCMYCQSYCLHILNINRKNINKLLNITFKKIRFLFFNLIDDNCTTKNYLNILNLTKNSPRIILMSDSLENLTFISNIKNIVFFNLDYYFYYYKFRAMEFFSHAYINCTYNVSAKLKKTNTFIPTYFSKNHSLNILVYKGFYSFINNLLKLRKYNILPPYTTHIILKITSNFSKNVQYAISLINSLIKNNFKIPNGSLLIMPCTMFSINKFTQQHSSSILLQYYCKNFLNKILNFILQSTKKIFLRYKIKILIIVDPVNY
ncbi:hypothetical protein [Buchnera aphidicola]|uniref:Primosomal protein N n=1 Tax=Buchnera aphidicola (Anoecia oenotherae) TaxID=1241833 RepID=A0A4D6Y043_9GAMM|nr:hypothetical protein [Buchnera aphidicola]QCI19231.1 hypothetical protein D9V65_00500 [Buchnera aphidicola (Anoecia oenotherae)]